MPHVEAVLSIKQWGNNLGVRLPQAVARAADLHADQRVCVAADEGRIIITPIIEPGMTLEERLARFDPARHGGELLVSTPVGAEKW
jgi:antitoxin MazE